MDNSACPTCAADSDAGDNFCRRCGVAISGSTLPAVRGTTAPAVWQPQVSPVVKGAAVMAAGTVGQFLFRRMVRGLFAGGRRTRNAGAIQIRPAGSRERDGMVDDAQIITEMVMMRRVRVRRQS